ncbi:MAG: DUF6186 family protein [Microbacteriaceae bacterium]
MLRWLTIIVYLGVALASIIVVLWSRHRTDELSRLSTLVDRAMLSPAARITLIAFWWWIGWHFLFAQTIDG